MRRLAVACSGALARRLEGEKGIGRKGKGKKEWRKIRHLVLAASCRCVPGIRIWKPAIISGSSPTHIRQFPRSRQKPLLWILRHYSASSLLSPPPSLATSGTPAPAPLSGCPPQPQPGPELASPHPWWRGSPGPSGCTARRQRRPDPEPIPPHPRPQDRTFRRRFYRRQFLK